MEGPRDPSRSLSVMVVDNDPDSADSLSLLLEHWNHRVCVAYDGSSAIEVYKRQLPEIVFLDIGLPDIDGYEVARRLRASHRSDRLRIVAISGWGQPADRERSRGAGFDLHLVKPVDTAELARALEAADDGTIH